MAERTESALSRLLRPATWLLCGGLVLGLSACQEPPSHCLKPCKRVARCKTMAVDGEFMLGEKAPPADKACLAKCRDHPEDFAKCEAKKRVCSDLKNCRGSLRE